MYSQTNPAESKESDSKVKVRNADNFIYDSEEKETGIQYLKGNVKMAHDSIFMYSDSAKIDDNLMTAVGEVIIIQEDTVNIFADSMTYNSNTNQAELFDNVVLDNGDQKLFSNLLFYNTLLKQASYRDTAILKNARTTLTSIRGTYSVKNKMADFYEQVVVIDSSFEIHADSMRYDIGQDKAIFNGPTWINKEDQEIYCEDGFYLISDGTGFFTKNAYINDKGNISKANEISFSEKDSLLILDGNASYQGENETATADKITMDESSNELIMVGNAVYIKDSTIVRGPKLIYDTENKNVKVEGKSKIEQPNKILIADYIDFNDGEGKGYAEGNVDWKDTLENISLLADFLHYEDASSGLKTYGDSLNPLFLKVDGTDSMYISADTLFKYKAPRVDTFPTDSIEIFNAYQDVKIWKEDMRAVADSMYYSSADSLFKLFGNPIMWSDSSQYTGDTIYIKMQNNKVSQVDAFKNGFIINMINSKYFDQIKGKHITSYIDSSEIKRMDVVGSAEALYFLKDENEAFIGANKTKSSKISFFFIGGELEDIKFYQQPESVLTPIQQAVDAELFLSDFNWSAASKPGIPPETIRIRTNRSLANVSILNTNIDSISQDSIPKDEFEQAIDEILDLEKANKKADKKEKKKRKKEKALETKEKEEK